MIKKILFGIAFVASVIACTDDYKDWASPQVVDQPEQISFGKGSISTVDVIKFADFTDAQTKVIGKKQWKTKAVCEVTERCQCH